MAKVEPKVAGIPPGRVDLWFVAAETFTADEACARSEKLLSDSERQIGARFLHEPDRHLYLLSHVLVRSALSHYVDVGPEEWRFDTGPWGKPLVAGPIVPDLQFNLSHAAGTALCAITAGAPVGVDIEPLSAGPAVRRIVPQYFSENERRALNEVGEEQADVLAVELWTLKEAFAKALGMGLHMRWTEFTIELPKLGSPVLQCPKAVADASAWHLGVLELRRTYTAAVAVGRCVAEPLTIVFRELKAPDLVPELCELVPYDRQRRWEVLLAAAGNA